MNHILHCKCTAMNRVRFFLKTISYWRTLSSHASMTEISFRGFSWMWIPRKNQNQCNGRSKSTKERDFFFFCNSLSLSTQKWVMTDCPPRQKKAASEWLCNEPLSLIQWRKPTKVKAVHKVRNKDLVLPLVLGWHFWDSSGKPRT